MLLTHKTMTDNESFLKYADECERLRNKFRVTRKVTKGDLTHFPNSGLKKGDTISLEPQYTTTVEAWRLLTEYYAKLYLEQQKHFFRTKYKVENIQTLEAEKDEIEKFFDFANGLSLSDAVESYSKQIGNSRVAKALTYLRFKAGFYENLEVEKWPNLSTIGLQETYVYGRYFLFYRYVKNALTSVKQPGSQNSLTAPVIATFCRMVNESGINPKEDEINATYCKRICSSYNLRYNDRVRQNFSAKPTVSNLNAVKRLLLPQMNESEKEKINKYLTSIQSMYG